MEIYKRVYNDGMLIIEVNENEICWRWYMRPDWGNHYGSCYKIIHKGENDYLIEKAFNVTYASRNHAMTDFWDRIVDDDYYISADRFEEMLRDNDYDALFKFVRDILEELSEEHEDYQYVYERLKGEV